MSTEAMQVKDASGRYLAKAAVQEVPPGYKRTEVGVIPEDWECVRFGDVVDLLTGFPFPSSGYTNSGVLLVRGSNVKRGQLDWENDITKCWPAVTSDIERYQLRKGDLVVAMDGAWVGRSYAAISDADLPSLLLQRVARIRSSKVHQDLLVCWVASDSFVTHVDSVKTHTAIPHISPGDIRKLLIAVPTKLPEQRAIAEALSDVDGLLGALEALIAKKRAIKQAAMQQLLSGQTRLPGFSGAWETAVLPQATVVRKGQLITASSLIPGSVPVIAGGKTPAYFHAEANRFQPCVTVSASGASAGYVALHKEPIFASDCSTVEESKIVTIEFAYYWLLNIQEIVYGLQSGGAQPHVQPKDLARLHIAYPALAEQQAIATVLSDMDAEIAALERRRDKTRALKQGMLQQLLTGRIRLI